METHFKTIPTGIMLKENVAGSRRNFCQSFADTLLNLVNAAAKIEAFCMPMYFQYELIDYQGEVRFTSKVEKVGLDFDTKVCVPLLSYIGLTPYTAELEAWRFEIDTETIVPYHLRGQIRTVRVVGRAVVDLDYLASRTVVQTASIDGQNFKRLKINPLPGPKNELIKTIDLLDAQVDRSLPVEINDNPLSLNNIADQRPVTENDEITHLQGAEERQLTDDAPHTELATAETQPLVADSDLVKGVGLAAATALPDAISSVTDKITLSSILDSLSLTRGHEDTDSADALIISPGKFGSDMSAEASDLDCRTNDSDPVCASVGDKPGLTVALLGGVGEVPELPTPYEKSLHDNDQQKSEIQHPQSVVHDGQMGVDRGVGDDDSVAHPDPVRSKIPDAFDTCSDHGVGDVLSAVDGHGNDADADIHLFDQLLEPVDVKDRNTPDFSPDNPVVDVNARNDVEAITLEAGVGNEGRPETA